MLVIEGYWQSFKYFDPYQDVIRSELTFRKASSEKNRRIIDEIESVDAIAVHVRRGDYVTSPNNYASLGTCSLEYYRKADTYIGRHVKKPHYYIFTDDAEWARDNLTFFLGPTRVVDHNLGKADSEDFRLMTHCIILSLRTALSAGGVPGWRHILTKLSLPPGPGLRLISFRRKTGSRRTGYAFSSSEISVYG